MEIREFFGGEITIADTKLVSFLLALVVGLLITFFMKKSRMGRAIRATSQDARAARIMGVDTDRVYAFTFSLNALFAGLPECYFHHLGHSPFLEKLIQSGHLLLLLLQGLGT
ncbi:MAG: hypothetical protein Ct9H300mP28_28180 [Pseudomonadota bacterium]|nr:MAG: hypothetical protein Ct9H300mP28_28180 [Pseudomonadota bacterium]